MVRKYLRDQGHPEKDEILVPDSAHGTNPASAAMGGFRVIKVPSDERGLVSVDQVEKAQEQAASGGRDWRDTRHKPALDTCFRARFLR